MIYESNNAGEPLTLGDLRQFVQLCDTVGLHSDLIIYGQIEVRPDALRPVLMSAMIETGSDRYGESKV